MRGLRLQHVRDVISRSDVTMRNSSTLSFALAIGEINKNGLSRNLAAHCVRCMQPIIDIRKERRTWNVAVAAITRQSLFFILRARLLDFSWVGESILHLSWHP